MGIGIMNFTPIDPRDYFISSKQLRLSHPDLLRIHTLLDYRWDYSLARSEQDRLIAHLASHQAAKHAMPVPL
jgi:hypothetical protein